MPPARSPQVLKNIIVTSFWLTCVDRKRMTDRVQAPEGVTKVVRIVPENYTPHASLAVPERGHGFLINIGCFHL